MTDNQQLRNSQSHPTVTILIIIIVLMNTLHDVCLAGVITESTEMTPRSVATLSSQNSKMQRTKTIITFNNDITIVLYLHKTIVYSSIFLSAMRAQFYSHTTVIRHNHDRVFRRYQS